MDTPKRNARRYLASLNDETLAQIMAEHINEVGRRAVELNARTIITFVPIIDDISRKWVTFASIANKKIESEDSKVSPGGFLRVLKDVNPKLYQQYISTKVQIEFEAMKKSRENGKTQ